MSNDSAVPSVWEAMTIPLLLHLGSGALPPHRRQYIRGAARQSGRFEAGERREGRWAWLSSLGAPCLGAPEHEEMAGTASTGLQVTRRTTD